MWPNPQETADLVTFIVEFFKGKLHFLWSVYYVSWARICYRISFKKTLKQSILIGVW